MPDPDSTFAPAYTPPAIVSPLISATMIADSISAAGVRLITMELVYPRFIHSEFMTHRVFSRNASSSRAIPVARALKMIYDNPAVPASWRMNEPGMQGYQVANEVITAQAQQIWLNAMHQAAGFATQMDKLGIHKQIVNRLTEPFAHIKTIVTGVWWNNFDVLRDHEMADPTMEALAKAIVAARTGSAPKPLADGEWHLPYVIAAELAENSINDLLKLSVARCARVSYNNFDGTPPSADADFVLHDRLVVAQPIHASPAEHQATPDVRGAHGQWMNPHRHGNLTGWQQYRKFLVNENMDAPTV